MIIIWSHLRRQFWGCLLILCFCTSIMKDKANEILHVILEKGFDNDFENREDEFN